MERHGSLPVAVLRAFLDDFGFGLEIGPKAVHRLALRQYDDLELAA